MAKKKIIIKLLSGLFSWHVLASKDLFRTNLFLCVLVEIVHRSSPSTVRAFFFEHIITHSLFVNNNIEGCNVLLLNRPRSVPQCGNCLDNGKLINGATFCQKVISLQTIGSAQLSAKYLISISVCLVTVYIWQVTFCLLWGPGSIHRYILCP